MLSRQFGFGIKRLMVFLTIAAMIFLDACDANLLLQPPSDSRHDVIPGIVETPVFNLASGTFSTDQLIEITCATAGATIYYTLTTDGSIPAKPSAGSTKYTTPIAVSGNGTVVAIKAIAMKSDMVDSSVAMNSYAINYSFIAPPQFSLAAGSYSADQSISISCPTAGAIIYYTVTSDGSTPPAPTAASTQYTGAIPVTGNGANVKIKAIALKSGMADSTVTATNYTINYPQIPIPKFSPGAGSYSADQLVSIWCAIPGTTIYYTMTTDGSVPSAPGSTSSIYTTPIPVSGNGAVATIKAIAVKPNMADSTIAVANYSINYSQVSTPQFSLTAGSYASDQSISISCATVGAILYYTMTSDGSTPPAPTVASTQYTGAIPVAGNGANVKIKAIAIATNYADSAIAYAAYAITYPGSITVSLNPPSANPIVFSGAATTLQKGSSMTITTTFAATSYAWYLDFSAVPASTAASYTMSTSSLGYGMHTLVLVVGSGGIQYSGSFNFQVTQ